jgi:hypothetical protein
MKRKSTRTSKAPSKSKGKQPAEQRLLLKEFDLPSGGKVKMEVVQESSGQESLRFCLWPKRGKVICVCTCGGNSVATRTCKKGIVDLCDCTGDSPSLVCH